MVGGGQKGFRLLLTKSTEKAGNTTQRWEGGTEGEGETRSANTRRFPGGKKQVGKKAWSRMKEAYDTSRTQTTKGKREAQNGFIQARGTGEGG